LNQLQNLLATNLSLSTVFKDSWNQRYGSYTYQHWCYWRHRFAATL